MANNTLSIKNLTKRFGANTIINDISLEVPEGSIFGFIGQNGAGKTTTMKMILGLLKQDGGEIEVCGERVLFGDNKTNKYIGFLPDVPEFYNYMKPKEYLKLCGEITGMSSDLIKSRTKELLELVGLGKNSFNRKIGGFSRGMKQRLGVAQALLNEPKLLICDEPTSALDPIGRKEILDILLKIKGKTTVIFSTHILSDVERICDRAALLNNGKIAMQGELSELKARHRANNINIEFANSEEKERFVALENIKKIDVILESEDTTVGSRHAVTLQQTQSTQKVILNALAENNIMPLKLEVEEPTIESLFLEVVK